MDNRVTIVLLAFLIFGPASKSGAESVLQQIGRAQVSLTIPPVAASELIERNCLFDAMCPERDMDCLGGGGKPFSISGVHRGQIPVQA